MSLKKSQVRPDAEFALLKFTASHVQCSDSSFVSSFRAVRHKFSITKLVVLGLPRVSALLTA
jgi:hypothetical protein